MDQVLYEYLESFVALRIVEEKHVPRQISNALTSPYKDINYIMKSELPEENENLFKAFLSDFDNYLIESKQNKVSVSNADVKLRLSLEVDRFVELSNKLERVREEKNLVALSVLNQLRHLNELKKQYEEALEYKSLSEALSVDGLELKLEHVKMKVVSKPSACVPNLAAAFQNLHKLLLAEKTKLEINVCDKNVLLKRYQETDGTEEYDKILMEYKKLLHQKETLLIQK